MKQSTAIFAAATIGIVAAMIWHFNRPADPFLKSDEVAHRAGFTSGERYGEALKLNDKVRKAKSLSNSDFVLLRDLVVNEGESGQLLALSVILPLDESHQMRQALEVCREAVTNRNLDPMPDRVLTSFRNRDAAVVDEFLRKYPNALVSPAPTQ